MADQSDMVIEGKGPWLFLKRGNNSAMAQQTGELRFSDAEFDKWTDALLARHGWCEEHGALYRHLFAPDKESVYRDMLPDEVVPRLAPHGERLVPTLCRRLGRSHPGLLSYPREELEAARATMETYYPTDTHWNGWGAFVAYRTLIESLQEAGIPCDPVSEKDLVFRLQSSGGDLGSKLTPARVGPFIQANCHPQRKKLLYNNGVRNNGWVTAYRRKDSEAADLPRCLVFGDSFMRGIGMRFLAESFRETILVHTSSGLDRDLLAALDPDVLIGVSVERFAIRPPKDTVSVSELATEKRRSGHANGPEVGRFPFGRRAAAAAGVGVDAVASSG